MTLPNRKVRAILSLMGLMSKLRILPTSEKALQMPMAKRLALASPPFLLGKAPDVPTRDENLTTRDGGSIRLRVYEPVGASAPVLYAHGGGFVAGGIAASDHICRRLAVDSGAIVVSVEYRLAPDYPYPVPINDVEDALEWLLTQHWNDQAITVAGDSAGGNLAASLALRARARGLSLAGQVLLYPALDLTVSGDPIVSYDGLGLSHADMVLCATTYLAGADPLNPDASPVHEPNLSGLPPTFVLTLEHDPLRGEGTHYANRLREAGVDVAHLDVPGHVHGSLSVPRLYEGIDDIYADITSFIRSPRRATNGS